MIYLAPKQHGTALVSKTVAYFPTRNTNSTQHIQNMSFVLACTDSLQIYLKRGSRARVIVILFFTLSYLHLYFGTRRYFIYYRILHQTHTLFMIYLMVILVWPYFKQGWKSVFLFEQDYALSCNTHRCFLCIGLNLMVLVVKYVCVIGVTKQSWDNFYSVCHHPILRFDKR